MKRIESVQNAQVKHWKKLVTSRKERDKTGEYIVEGFHLVEEALKNKDQVIHLIIREGTALPRQWPLDDVALVEVTEKVAKEIAETETSQGVFAHCKQTVFTGADQAKWTKLLLIDSVQDPGNIGTMIRTADAAGIDAVVLGKGCADAYNPKTLRSAQGSHFHLPVIRGDLSEWIGILKQREIPVYGTALENAVDYREVEKPERFALLVGNEGSGVQKELLEKTDQNVIIPILGQAESLNVAVAAGILLYKFME
ncbi:RNA methyltransferase [Ureibacillus sp. FSL K6-8385]|uniref:RNA methyltransferase n=1 Tax=Ureibacillus terrenus TaxID=118246 RepID=A0A540V1H9_9BACL|nr:RNA methyltransferase [Ureibacillus terrenus]MED3661981.1 RNA methyltransferase [Ureibacillus terrenus]MED3764756.1 RNA methyltransferase [Ureibacillus terrenus]TQE90610.1 RNA methyltransferase [Ureibacillus terrenus]